MHTDTERKFKDKLYEQFARIGKSLSNPHRLEILELLAEGERCVEDIAEITGTSIANASQHLGVLRASRMVEIRRIGNNIYYRLADEKVFYLLQSLRALGETRFAEIDRITRDYLKDRTSLRAVTAGELADELMNGNVILLDVRPVEEFQEGHIQGALSMPMETIENHLNHLPKNREIVAYCRGPYCVLSDHVVAYLNAQGYSASRLSDGYPEWKWRGLPVEIEEKRIDA
jgi:DNA-binding transcriptional ArsR family regulator/rhodanese-related sulfurtransferase